MKRNFNSKFLCSALVSAVILGCISCAAGTEHTGAEVSDENPVGDAVTEPVSKYPDAVPELDFGGAPFRTIQQDPDYYGFYIGEETGDAVGDAIFRRIQNVEERLNIDVLETSCMLYSDVASHLKKSVLAGGDDYELVLNQIFRSGSDALDGLLYDWKQVPYVDLDQPWYTKSIRNATIGDRLYMIESDLSNGYINQTWFLLYNKTITDSMDSEDLYTVVDEGRWTTDYLYSIASSLYQDLNGNAKADKGDRFGLATSSVDDCMITAIYYAMDGRMVVLNEDATAVTHVIEEERSIDRIRKLSDLLVNMPNVYNKLKYEERIPRFVSDEFVFVHSQVKTLLASELRNCESEYGVLPLPKYDEAQTEYYTLVDGGADILTVPATAENLEMIGAAIEIMSAYSYEHVTSTYINVGLEQKGTRDEESVRMLRLILDSRVIDFGYLYDTGSGWCFKIEPIMKKRDTIASQIEKMKGSVDRYYTRILEEFNSDPA